MFGGRLPETENKKIYQTSWQIARPIMTVAVHLIAGKHGGTFGMSSSLGEGVEWVAEGSASIFLKVNDTVAGNYSFIYLPILIRAMQPVTKIILWLQYSTVGWGTVYMTVYLCLTSYFHSFLLL